jgi:hypothetical protein
MFLHFRPNFSIICVGVVCALVLVSAATAGPVGLGKVKAFDAYSVYFAGQGISGVPFEDVEKDAWPDRKLVRWSFYYGDCALPAGEGGCSVPLQIHNYPTCRRWASAYPGEPRLFNFRGAKAAWVSTAGSLEIYTGRTTVVIFAHRSKLAMRAARLLRGVRQVQPSRLPPPVPGSLEGELPCQVKPG